MQFISNSEKDTLSLGKKIARKLRPADILCLIGELGSGKTVLAKGICAGLGVIPKEVTSPTFVLMRQYEGRLTVYHMDLYRLKNPDEILSIGYEEFIFGEGVTLIEWADKLGYLTPKQFLEVYLEVTGQQTRKIFFKGYGQHYQELAKKIYEDIKR
ncbi:MAG: tRNA (adenosine(37)-N6)-threonylcarbamoyltransferase complex ATPase subunit type 1 TsaE [Candidatus Omnitrophica bacterium]|nr:tRNA (adenosine(37)-N6)-threonylcarbamoyltransferase complex ATPase subunit type 1 TsaE [Candidatus Omnitrophota bacterium]